MRTTGVREARDQLLQRSLNFSHSSRSASGGCAVARACSGTMARAPGDRDRRAAPRRDRRRSARAPSRPAPHPRRSEDRPGPRRGREPVRRRRAAGALDAFLAHARADPLVDGLPRRLGAAAWPRDRARSPTSRARARARRRQAHRRCRAPSRTPRRRRRTTVEIQRLAEADDEFVALAGIEPLRIEPAQPIARVRQIVGRRALAEPLEVGARRDQVGAVRQRGRQPRALGGGDRRLELPLVVEKPRARERIGRIGGAKPRAQKASTKSIAQPSANHRRDGSTRRI